MQSALPTDAALPALTVALLGNDAVLAARPATPVQLAHACLQAGFQMAVPASWGDELVATECERQLATRGRAPAIQCSCPLVAARLLAAGGELTPFLVPLAAPPVAAARYLRRFAAPGGVHITYVGECPGAVDETIDARVAPADFLDALASRGIQVARQPLVFDSVIPPDRRRHASLPGGLPAPERLWQTDRRTVVELDGESYLSELAQHLVAGECVLLDVAPRVGCACSGAVEGTPAAAARRSVTSLEPPRAPHPPVNTSVDLHIARALPVLPMAPQTTAPLPSLLAPDVPAQHRPPQPGTGRPRAESPIGMARRRTTPPGFFRTHTATVPQTRSGAGRALPRAYLGRRNSPPLGVRAISESAPPPADAEGATPGDVTPEHVSSPADVAVATPFESMTSIPPAVTAPAEPVVESAASAPPRTDVVVPVPHVPAADQPATTAAESRWAPPGPGRRNEPAPAAAPPGAEPSRVARPTPVGARDRLPTVAPRPLPRPRGRPTPQEPRRPSRPAGSAGAAPAVPDAGGWRFALRLVLLLLAALAGGAVLALLVDRYATVRRPPTPRESQRAPGRGAQALPGPALRGSLAADVARAIPLAVEPEVIAAARRRPEAAPRAAADRSA